MKALLFALLLLNAGCASGAPAADSPRGGPSAGAGKVRGPDESESADIQLRIECDRARVVIPESWRTEQEYRGGVTTNFNEPTVAYYSIGRITVVSRERDIRVECAGKDLSVIAEGGVRLFRLRGKVIVEEGPYQVVIYRNGQMLRR